MAKKRSSKKEEEPKHAAPRFFMLEYEPEEDEAVICGHPDSYEPDIDWHTGERFTRQPKAPVQLTIYVGDAGNGRLPSFVDVPIPVMSKKMVEVLRAAGVENLETYPAIIHDQNTGTAHDSHIAYNIVGLVAAADNKRTKRAKGSKHRVLDADIDSLAIDETKPGALKLFRLAESVNGIVVHRTICDALEKAAIGGLAFLPPDEWIG